MKQKEESPIKKIIKQAAVKYKKQHLREKEKDEAPKVLGAFGEENGQTNNSKG